MMTDQEAEMLAAKLTRIWAPEGCITTSLWRLPRSHVSLRFLMGIAPDVIFSFGESEPKKGCGYWWRFGNIFRLTHERGHNICAQLSWNQHANIIEGHLWQQKETLFQRQFAAQWLPYFRRGCWLCGCDIEATMHEKVEWVHGFTEEEVEVWKLTL